MSERTLHFWYEFASPYSYLTAMRIEDAANAADVDIIWHPFLLGAIYKIMKLPAPPMQLSPQKEAYMWMDIARQAKIYGLPLKKPNRFPRAAVLPARVALVGRTDSWCPEFSRWVYKANFAADKDIAKTEVVEEILKNMGLNAKKILEQAVTPEIKEALRQETDEAYKKGIFGVPTFFVGNEMFWGDDRLEQALAAAAIG